MLELRSKRAGEPVRVKLRRLGYCDEHKQASSLPTFLSDEGFTKLSKLLRESGLPEPDPRLTELAWERATSSDRSRLARRQDRTLSASSADPDADLAF